MIDYFAAFCARFSLCSLAGADTFTSQAPLRLAVRIYPTTDSRLSCAFVNNLFHPSTLLHIEHMSYSP